MLSTTIKRATVQDADRLTRLIHSCGAYRGPYASIISGYRVTSDYIARHRVFVAVDETERLQGFYALLLEPPELDLAFVADDVQGSGVGRLLIEHMITQARAAGLTEVRVVSILRPRSSTGAGRRTGRDRCPLTTEGRLGASRVAVHHHVSPPEARPTASRASLANRKAPAGIGAAGAFRCTACSVKGEKTITSRASVPTPLRRHGRSSRLSPRSLAAA